MNKMHHLYPTSTGDPLCPLGFHPQVRWPTRCKRCFRDYKDHKDHVSAKKTVDVTSSSPSLSIWEPAKKTSSETSDGRRGWSSTSSLAKDGENGNGISRAESATTFCSATDLSSVSLKDLREPSPSQQESTRVVTAKPPRPKTYGGSGSDTLTSYRRYSSGDGEGVSPERPQRLQIRGVIEKSNGNSSDNDAEFVIKVRKSQSNNQQNGPKIQSNVRLRKSARSEQQNEIDRLELKLNDMKSKCDRLEKEKSEMLMRRFASMESNVNTSTKSTANEIMKLQKYIKELQGKYDVICEDKNTLVSRVKSLEKELTKKTNQTENEKVAEELRTKLGAAETLCESLMDENEEMKKEIRELEEEIYEMQDTFREEQADEYTTLRRNLDQANKNCRVLSFKLRKYERKTEQLEVDKSELETKYEHLKKIEELLRKAGNEYSKSKNPKKLPQTESAFKAQLKKLSEGTEQDIGEILNIMLNIANTKTGSGPANATNDRFEKLQKEHELLKENLDRTTKELAAEKESHKKSKANNLKDESMVEIKKKLEDSINTFNIERKLWESEKSQLQDDKEKLKSKMLSLSADKLKVYNEVVQLKKELEKSTATEKEVNKLESNLADLKKELSQEKDKAKKFQDELMASREKESKIAKTLSNIERVKSQLDDELKQKKSELESLRNSNSKRMTELNSELTALKKDRDKIKYSSEKEKEKRELEISSLRRKNSLLEKVDANSKNVDDVKKGLTEKITSLENDLRRLTKKYEDLNNRQSRLLEEKASLEKENHLLSGQIIDHKQDYTSLETEFKEIRSFYMAKEVEWAERYRKSEEELDDYRKIAKTVSQGDLRQDNIKLKSQCETLSQQISDLKKANDDLTSKLKDYTAISKVQRNLGADSSALESELRIAKNTLENSERAKKADLAQCKLRYEQRITAIGDEMKTIQTQLSRYKRERDTYKQMLEGAQKSIAELKSSRSRKQSGSTGKSDEDDDKGASNALLQKKDKQICNLEDEVSEAKLEVSKLRTELVSEQSAWKIKYSELQSKINELEEERLLGSGRSKMPGLKIKMELAWQKEREEQQRLLQETATLARDLRQTLFEVERERDKERLENKRKLDQIKKAQDEEKDENKKKLIELQCDLLELRDAHAKLRTSNEKMRRERERHEREREELRAIIASKRRQEHTEARNINSLLQQVDDLTRLFPEINGTVTNSSSSSKKTAEAPYTPTPPRRTKSKSRETSPMVERKNDGGRATSEIPNGKTEKLEYTVKRLMEVAKELQESKRIVDETASKSKKLSKRSTSTDNESQKPTHPARTKPSLKRKSLSLEQTTSRRDQSIWGNNSALSSAQSSVQSLNGSTGSMNYSLHRDSSVESHLSNESTKSEILRGNRGHHNNKGIIRKITTKLTKSASVDDPNVSRVSSLDSWQMTSGSETSISDVPRNGKKNLKKKLSDMFKRGSRNDGYSSSRENSRPASRMSTVSAKP